MLFPHRTKDYSTGNSKTFFYYSSYNPSICITYLRTRLHSQSHYVFTKGFSICWPIKSLTRVFWIFNWLRLSLDSKDSCRTVCRSKRQWQTTVVLRTPFPRVIFFNQVMLLLASNHFLIFFDVWYILYDEVILWTCPRLLNNASLVVTDKLTTVKNKTPISVAS